MPAIRTRQPAEEVVEGTVLHHEDHDVAYATRAVRESGRGGAGRGAGQQVSAGDGSPSRRGHDLEELATGQHNSRL